MIKEFIPNIFSNREIVLLIYLLLFIIWMLTQKGIRNSILNVLKVLTSKRILLSIFSLIIYILLLTYGLYLIGLWNFLLLKDTIYWTFGVGFVLLINSNRAIEEDNYFEMLIKDNFKLVLVIEFILGLYVFGLVAEIILMSFVIVFSLTFAYSEVHNEYAKVAKILQGMLSIIGLVYLIYSGYMIYKDIDEFASFETLQSFLFPIVMMLLFLPFAYFYALYMHYESLFGRLNYSLKENIIIRKYARRRILCSVNFSIKRLKKITPGFLFAQCNNKSDIRLEISRKLNGKFNELDF